MSKQPQILKFKDFDWGDKPDTDTLVKDKPKAFNDFDWEEKKPETKGTPETTVPLSTERYKPTNVFDAFNTTNAKLPILVPDKVPEEKPQTKQPTIKEGLSGRIPVPQFEGFALPEQGTLDQALFNVAPEFVKRQQEREELSNKLWKGIQQGSETIEPLSGQRLGDLKLENAPMGEVRNAIDLVVNSGLKMIPGTIEALGLIADKIVQRGLSPQMRIEDFIPPAPTVSKFTGDIGKTVREGIDTFAPTDPKIKGFFSSTLPSAVGSGLGFLAGGLGGKAIKLPTMLSTLLLSTSQAAEEYNSALKQTGDYNKAYNVFIGNLPFAATEVVPFEFLFKRLDKLGGRKGTQLLIDMLVQGTVEGSQEVIQQFGTNLNAKLIYDASRSLSEGTLEGGAAGFITGMLLSGIGNIASKRLEEGNLTPEEIKHLIKTIEKVNLSKAKVEAEFKNFQTDATVRDLLNPEKIKTQSKDYLKQTEQEPLQPPARDIEKGTINIEPGGLDLGTLTDLTPQERQKNGLPQTESFDKDLELINAVAQKTANGITDLTEQEKIIQEVYSTQTNDLVKQIKESPEFRQQQSIIRQQTKQKQKLDTDNFAELTRQFKNAQRRRVLVDPGTLTQGVEGITTPELKTKAETLFKEATEYNNKLQKRNEFTLENLSRKKFGTESISTLDEEQQQALLSEFNEMKKQGFKEFKNIQPITKGGGYAIQKRQAEEILQRQPEEIREQVSERVQPGIEGIRPPEEVISEDQKEKPEEDVSKGQGKEETRNVKEEDDFFIDLEPTEAQKEAGNYKKGHIKRDGFDISIENPKGSIRSGKDSDGKTWETKINNDYGYIKGTVGKDKDHIDVFLSDNYQEDAPVFIVNQTTPEGKFDEHKVMLGFTDKGEAEQSYISNYEKGKANYSDIIEMPMDEFKQWSKDQNLTKKPAVKPTELIDDEMDDLVNQLTEEPPPEPPKSEGKLSSWYDKFEELKSKNDLAGLDNLYGKVKIALNGVAQGRNAVPEFEALKKEIESYAEEIKPKPPETKIEKQPEKTLPEDAFAIKLKSGKVIADKEAENHTQIIEKNNINEDDVVDVGFISENKFLTTKELSEKVKMEIAEEKKPYEMTDDEWLDKTRFYRSGKDKMVETPEGNRVILKAENTPSNYKENSRDFLLNIVRKRHIAQALKEGKDIPEEVLKNYSDLQISVEKSIEKPEPDNNAVAIKRMLSEGKTLEQISTALKIPINEIEPLLPKEEKEAVEEPEPEKSPTAIETSEQIMRDAKGYPIAIDDYGTEHTIKLWGTHIVRIKTEDPNEMRLGGTGWEWYGFKKSGDIWEGFVHGFEDEYGSFSESELKENGVTIRTDPKDLLELMPPIGWKWKQKPKAIPMSKLGKAPEPKPKVEKKPEPPSIIDDEMDALINDIDFQLKKPKTTDYKKDIGFKTVTSKQKPTYQLKPGEKIPADKQLKAIELVGKFIEKELYPFDNIVQAVRQKYGDERTERLLPALKSGYSAYLSNATDAETEKMDSFDYVKKYALEETKPEKKNRTTIRPVLATEVRNLLIDVNKMTPAQADYKLKGTDIETLEIWKKELTERGKGETGTTLISRPFIQRVREEIRNGNQLTKTQLEKIAKEYDITDPSIAKEQAELAIVAEARKIINETPNEKEAYDKVVEMYGNQPNLTHRTNISVENQQYSTPAPISYVAGLYVADGIGNGDVLEPSAGNGMLVIAFNTSQVYVNELDEIRNANLRQTKYEGISNVDAEKNDNIFNKKFDGIITNPPFGSVEEKKFNDYKLNKLEHVMAANALKQMRNDGRASIIIGGHNRYDNKGRLQNDRTFFNWLYHYYNVEAVLNISGDLYKKQGTQFPIRLILINGIKETPQGASPLFDAQRDAEIKDFEDLYNRVKEIRDGNILQPGVDAQRRPGGITDVRNPEGKGIQEAGRTETLPETEANKPDKEKPAGSGKTTTVSERPSGSGEPISGKPGAISGTDTGKPPLQPGIEPKPKGGGNRETERKGNEGDIQSGFDRESSSITARAVLDSEKPYTQYESESKGVSLDTVIPRNMDYDTRKELRRLADEVGGIDEFVKDKLGYESTEKLFSHLGAEQIDATAMAIVAIEKGQGMIIGDMTGVGKGRIAAAVIRYAVKEGYKPIFLTEKAYLFSDLYRDLVDIDSKELNPFIVNNPGGNESPDIVDEDGNVIHRAYMGVKKNNVLSSGDIGKHDFIVTTYSQFNSEKRGLKRNFIEEMATGNIIIMDESHTASGDSNTGEFFSRIVQKTKGVTFLSATFAKRPDNMPIYALKTAISEANLTRDDLVSAIESGGVALQEILSTDMVEAGQMIRREKSYDGISIDYKPLVEKKAEHSKVVDSITDIIRDIINFQNENVKPIIDAMDTDAASEGERVTVEQGTNMAGVDNTPFASKVFNVIDQLLFSLKADSAADEAIRLLKENKKPVIAIKNTMESFLNYMGVQPGDVLETTDFSLIMRRGLEGVMRIRTKDVTGEGTPGELSLNDLSEDGRKEYRRILDKISQTTSGITISPIDQMIYKLEKEGYKVGEITGRAITLKFRDINCSIVEKRTERGKKKILRDYNNGTVDVILLNASGATGSSAHSSPKFKDQRQRVMVTVQIELNINTEIQKRGRVNRTGQVNKPAYITLSSAIPAEQRLLMMAKKKLKSLDANVSSDQKQAGETFEASDFLNHYGDRIVVEYLKENRELNDMLLDPLKMNEMKEEEFEKFQTKENAAHKVTGRVAILPTQLQEEFYSEMEHRYNDFIEYVDSVGENDLEVKTFRYDAVTITSRMLVAGKGGFSPFGRDSIVENTEVNVLKKPFKIEKINELQDKYLEGTGKKERKSKLQSDFKSFWDEWVKTHLDRKKEVIAKDFKISIEDVNSHLKGGLSIEDMEKRFPHLIGKSGFIEREFTKYQELYNKLFYQGEFVANNILGRYDIGRVYKTPLVRDQVAPIYSNGIFLGWEVNTKRKNPYAPSAIRLRFAVADSRQMVIIPGSQRDWLNDLSSETYSRLEAWQEKDIVENWDNSLPDSRREMKPIVTGNVLQAMKDVKGGQLVTYTTKEGGLKRGILLKDSKAISSGEVRVPIKRAKKFIQQIGLGDFIESASGDLALINDSNKYWLIEVPASKQKGGKYYLDEGLRKLVADGRFDKVGDRMRGNVLKKNLDALIDLLQDDFGISVRLSQKDIKKITDDDISFQLKGGKVYKDDFNNDIPARFSKIHEYKLGHPRLKNTKIEVVEPKTVYWTRETIESTGYTPELLELELLKKGDFGYEEGKEKYAVAITGYHRSNPEQAGSSITVSSRATRSAYTEELIHTIVKGLEKESPRLLRKITDWESGLREQAKELGIDIPQEGETFAQAMVFSHLGYADEQPNVAEVYEIPKDILDEFTAILNEGKVSSDVLRGGSQRGAIRLPSGKIDNSLHIFRNKKRNTALQLVSPENKRLNKGRETYVKLKSELGEKADVYLKWLKDMRQEYGKDFDRDRKVWKQIKDASFQLKPAQTGKIEVDNEFIERAKKHFGVTDNYKVAGWITTDGSMLDFSDKSSGGQSKFRTQGHEEIGKFEKDKTHYNKYSFNEMGNIRVISLLWDNGIEIAQPPTTAQKEIIKKIVADLDGNMNVEIRPDSDNPFYKVYRKGTTPEEILGDISDYFAGKIRRPSSLSQFRASYQLKKPQTGTPEFKKWFGDSKVVDENGKPLVVYHGTPDASFTEFKSEYKGTRTNHNPEDVGFHFTNDPALSDAYSKAYLVESYTIYKKMFPEDTPTALLNDMGTAPGTYPIYLSIQNPLVVDVSKQINKSLIDQAKADGYDGIIAGAGKNKNEYVAFKPTQIKSAIANRGTFNVDNPNISYQLKKPKRDKAERFSGKKFETELAREQGREPETGEGNIVDFGAGLGQVFTVTADKITDFVRNQQIEKELGIYDPKLRAFYREFLTAPVFFFDKEPQLKRFWDIVDRHYVRNINEEIAILTEDKWLSGKGWRDLKDIQKKEFLSALEEYEQMQYELQRDEGATELLDWADFADEYALTPDVTRFLFDVYKPTIETALDMVKDVDRYKIINETKVNPYLENYYDAKAAKAKQALIDSELEKGKDEFFNDDPNAEALYENELLKMPQGKVDVVKALELAWGNNPQLRETLAEVLIDKKYEKIDGKAYFTSSRLEKEYFLNANRKTTPEEKLLEGKMDDRYFTTNDSLTKLKALRVELEAEGYTIRDKDIGKFADAQEEILQNAITQEDVLDLAISAGVDQDNPILERLVKTIQAKGFSRHFIPKRFIPGFEYTTENFEEAIYKYINSVPFYKNRTIGGKELEKTMSQLKAQGILDPKSANNRYIQDLRTKIEGRDVKLSTALRAVASTYYLALSPAYLSQQIVQPLNTLLPLLPVVAKELGLKAIEAEKAFGESLYSSLGYWAWKVYDKTHRVLGRPTNATFGLDREFLSVIRSLERQGVGKPLRAMELAGQKVDPKKYYASDILTQSTKMTKWLATIAGIPGIVIEDFTRTIGIRAFYTLGKKAGLKGDKLEDFISTNIAKSYGPASGRLAKPPGYYIAGEGRMKPMKEVAQSTIESWLTFKNFAFMNFGQWGKIWRALRNNTMFRPIAYKLGAQIALGGLKYMMWTSSILTLLSGLYALLNVTEDPEEQYEGLFKHFNKLIPGLGDALYKGVASITFKVDLSAMFGQTAPLEEPFTKDAVQLIGGAPASAIEDIIGGRLPRGVRGFQQVEKYEKEGVKLGSRKLIPSEKDYKEMDSSEKKKSRPPVTEEEKIKRKLGFTPLRISDAYQEENNRQFKSGQYTDIIRNKVTDKIIPMIETGRGKEAREEFKKLFEEMKADNILTKGQLESVKTTNNFISQIVLTRLQQEERDFIKGWKNGRSNSRTRKGEERETRTRESETR